MSFIGIKFFSYFMNLLHLMTLSSQQFYLCNILFNIYIYDIFIKHAPRPWLSPVVRSGGRVRWCRGPRRSISSDRSASRRRALSSAVSNFNLRLHSSCIADTDWMRWRSTVASLLRLMHRCSADRSAHTSIELTRSGWAHACTGPLYNFPLLSEEPYPLLS